MPDDDAPPGPASRKASIIIAVPPYDQPEDWIKQQLDADPHLGAAYVYHLMTPDARSDWSALGSDTVMRQAAEEAEPNRPRLSAFFLIFPTDDGYGASAVSHDRFPAAGPVTWEWRKIHRLMRRVPELRPAWFATLDEAKAAVDAHPRSNAAWDRGGLGWRPLLDEDHEWRHGGTWVRETAARGASEAWSRNYNFGTAVLWVAGGGGK